MTALCHISVTRTSKFDSMLSTWMGLHEAHHRHRPLQADMQAELRYIERAVTTGTRNAGRGLRTELRRQVTSAGLGRRLATGSRRFSDDVRKEQ